jgi:hypothetical protein
MLKATASPSRSESVPLGEPDAFQRRARINLSTPVLALEPAYDCVSAIRGLGAQIDERAHAAGGVHDFAGFGIGFQPGLDQQPLHGDDCVDAFVAVVGSQDKEHVVSLGAKPFHGFFDLGRAAVGSEDNLAVPRGSQLQGVLGVVGFAHPGDEKRHRGAGVHGLAEACRGLRIADAVVTHIQAGVAVDGFEPRGERAAAVVEPAVAVGVLHVRRARR